MTEDELTKERREREALHLPPVKLHTRDVEGHLGGHEWSQPFSAYIGPVIPNQTKAERDQWTQWWTIPYVLDTLKDELGEVVVQALVDWLTDVDSYHATCRRYGIRFRDLQSHYTQAKRIVRGLRPSFPRTFAA